MARVNVYSIMVGDIYTWQGNVNLGFSYVFIMLFIYSFKMYLIMNIHEYPLENENSVKICLFCFTFFASTHIMYVMPYKLCTWSYVTTGMILGLRPANERWRYFVMTSLIGWVQA